MHDGKTLCSHSRTESSTASDGLPVTIQRYRGSVGISQLQLKLLTGSPPRSFYWETAQELDPSFGLRALLALVPILLRLSYST